MEKFLNKYFQYIIYVMALSITLLLLYQAKKSHLLPFPGQGTDQLSIIDAAVGMYYKKMPQAGYKMSPGYTLFTYLLVVFSGAKLLLMRIFQAAIASLIPLFIYKLSRKLRMNFQSSQIAALTYCFYGPAILISLDFLRASMLALSFLLFVYFMLSAFLKKKIGYYMLGGIFAGFTILGRENFIPIVFLPLVVLFFRQYRRYITKKQIFTYLASLAAMLLPCIIYNYVNFNSFSIIPGNLNTVVGCYHGAGIEHMTDSSYRARFLKNIPEQFFKFISSYEIPNSLSFYAHKEVLEYMNIFIVPFNFILILATFGLIKNIRNHKVIFIALLAVGYVGTMLYFNMFYRFRIPVVPLLTVLAGAGFYAVMRMKTRPQRTITWCGILLLTWVTYSNPDHYRLPGERVSVAKVLIQNKRLLKAERYLDKLSLLSIFPVPVWVHLIRKYAESGDKTSADRVYKKFLTLSRARNCKNK